MRHANKRHATSTDHWDRRTCDVQHTTHTIQYTTQAAGHTPRTRGERTRDIQRPTHAMQRTGYDIQHTDSEQPTSLDHVERRTCDIRDTGGPRASTRGKDVPHTIHDIQPTPSDMQKKTSRRRASSRGGTRQTTYAMQKTSRPGTSTNMQLQITGRSWHCQGERRPCKIPHTSYAICDVSYNMQVISRSRASTKKGGGHITYGTAAGHRPRPGGEKHTGHATYDR